MSIPRVLPIYINYWPDQTCHKPSPERKWIGNICTKLRMEDYMTSSTAAKGLTFKLLAPETDCHNFTVVNFLVDLYFPQKSWIEN